MAPRHTGTGIRPGRCRCHACRGLRTSHPHPSSGPNREIRPLLRGRGRKGRTPLRSVSFVRYRNGAIPTICDSGIGMVRVRPGPNREIRRYFEVVDGRGCASLCSAFPMRSRNGGIPTIRDFGIGMIRGRLRPNREMRPFFRGCGWKGVCAVVSRASHAIRKRRNSNDLGFWCRGARHSILPQPARYARFSRLGPPGNGRTARAVRDGPAEGAYNASGADHETPHGRFRDPRHYPSEAPATRRRPFSRACAAPVSLRRPPPAPLQPGPCQARWNRSSQCLPPLWRTSWRPSRTCWPAWSDRR